MGNEQIKQEFEYKNDFNVLLHVHKNHCEQVDYLINNGYDHDYQSFEVILKTMFGLPCLYQKYEKFCVKHYNASA